MHTLKSKKLLLLSLPLFLCGLGCRNQDQSGQPEPIVLGAVYNLTGSQSTLDVPSSQGAKLAIEQANAESGKNGNEWQLILKDGQTNPDVLRAKVTEMITEYPSTAAFLGLSDTDQVLAAAGVAADSHRVFLTSGATSPKLPTQIPDYLFLACFGDNVQAAAAAEWAYNDLEARTVSVIYNSSDTYTNLLQGYFISRFEQLGGQILSLQPYGQGGIAQAIQGIQPADILFFAALPQDALEGVQMIRQAGFTAPIIGGDAFDEPATWQGHNEVKDVFFTTHAYLGADNPNPQVQAFRQAYMQAYAGEEPNAFAALGYDAAQLLIRATLDAKSPDPEDIRQAFSAIRNFEGVTGSISYGTDSPIPRKSVTIMEIKDGKETLSTQLVPEEVPAP
ncbi:MAG: ABC transporter substrate-binding protein [Phaeodactylibacter sp.]|nr:ABC transporter substrate-binding protein [Phaeodactylibacter sp.]MCB9053245.1 ABC transporter substrate-binding protein [Lewinellaceae bacterium]